MSELFEVVGEAEYDAATDAITVTRFNDEHSCSPCRTHPGRDREFPLPVLRRQHRRAGRVPAGHAVTAVTAPAPSKAGVFASEAEALGWEVERKAFADGSRLVRASRGREHYELFWNVNDRGNLVYHSGERWTADTQPEEVTNVKAALRDMAKIRAANGALLPFDPEGDDDKTVLEAVAGRTVRWRNSISGEVEEGEAPRGGVHLHITQGPKGENGGARILNFPDRHVTGFRAVYLDQIGEVS